MAVCIINLYQQGGRKRIQPSTSSQANNRAETIVSYLFYVGEPLFKRIFAYVLLKYMTTLSL